MRDLVNDEIARRSHKAKLLAERFRDLAGLPYKEFLQRTIDLGLDLDFITSVEMHKALNEER